MSIENEKNSVKYKMTVGFEPQYSFEHYMAELYREMANKGSSNRYKKCLTLGFYCTLHTLRHRWFVHTISPCESIISNMAKDRKINEAVVIIVNA